MSNPSRPVRVCGPVLIPVLLAMSPGGTLAQEDDEHELGRRVFLEAEPPCGICHMLADAETEGRIGPNLDQLQPTAERVMEALRSGPGAMPDYSESLSEEEMQAVADYVSAVAGGS